LLLSVLSAFIWSSFSMLANSALLAGSLIMGVRYWTEWVESWWW